MTEWDSYFNKFLSLNEMFGLLSKGSISQKTKESIYKRITESERSLRLGSKFSEDVLYHNLIEGIVEEWCEEENPEKYNRLFKLIEAYE